jgi:hypothetical protein
MASKAANINKNLHHVVTNDKYTTHNIADLMAGAMWIYLGDLNLFKLYDTLPK